MATPIPANQASFTLDEIVRATSGELVSPGPSSVTHVAVDSREVAPGGLFVCLVGRRVDGHDFAPTVSGEPHRAGALLVSRHVEVPSGVAVVRVTDTTRALGDLARFHRDRWGRRVVCITGSAGKTTTRRAVAAVLAGLGKRVHATRGNLNNLVGAPMVLLGLGADHDVAVVEIGTSLPGEIARLTEVARPDVGVVTRVALAHASGLGDLAGVVHEKGALPRGLPSSGTCIVNADDPPVLEAARGTSARVVDYGEAESAAVRIVSREVLGLSGARLGLRVEGRELSVETPLLGRAGALATAAAVAVACGELGQTPDGPAITRALAPLASEATGRLAATSLSNDIVLIDDSYNANRASMESSIEAARELAAARGARLVLVLGEMKELGDHTADEHRAVGLAAKAAKAAIVTAVGDAKALADAAGGELVADAEAAVQSVVPRLAAGDVVLVKGSRSVGLERVVAAVSARFSPASEGAA